MQEKLHLIRIEKITPSTWQKAVKNASKPQNVPKASKSAHRWSP
jgi:hypothetical protein